MFYLKEFNERWNIESAEVLEESLGAFVSGLDIWEAEVLGREGRSLKRGTLPSGEETVVRVLRYANKVIGFLHNLDISIDKVMVKVNVDLYSA